MEKQNYENKEENLDSESQDDSEILKKHDEEESIKKSLIPTFSTKDIIVKSTKISLKNWRQNLFSQIEFFITQIFSIYLPILKANIIDSITTSKTFDEIYFHFKKYLSFLLFKIFTQQFLEFIEYFFVTTENVKYKNIILEKIVKKDISFFDMFKPGELIEKMEKCEDYIEEDFISKMITLIQNLVKLLLICFYLYKTSFKLSIITIIVFILKAVTDIIEEKCTYLGNYEKRERAYELYNNSINELFNNIRMIKSFSKEEDEVKKIIKLKTMARFSSNIMSILIFKFTDLINEGSEALTLLFAGKYVLEKQLTLGKFTVSKQYLKEISNCYYEIKDIVMDFKKLLLGWKNILELWDFPIFIKSETNYCPKNIKGKITFKNITFSYPLKPDVNIFENLNFEVNPGKITAICGVSGSGKTTISNLLQRFYDPNKGNIFLDDIDLKDYNIEYLRKNIGFVEQEPILNNGTIEDNIKYGINNCNNEEFNRICNLTDVNSFMNDKNLFPAGEKTLVGQRGVKVSGGQKQRIAIARALLKNSKILIFDEATSALDAESENKVQTSIYKVAKEKNITTIIIAHRLSTIINADEIIVIKNGTVIERGNHQELIEKMGEYKTLFQKQLVKENEKM